MIKNSHFIVLTICKFAFYFAHNCKTYPPKMILQKWGSYVILVFIIPKNLKVPKAVYLHSLLEQAISSSSFCFF